MNAQDLSDAINLGILVLAIYGVCYVANMCCPPNPKAAAWDDAEQALARANRDVEQRDRLRLIKE